AALEQLRLAGVEELGPLEIERRRDVMAGLSTTARAFIERFGAVESHPWSALRRSELSPFEQQECLRALQAWRKALQALSTEASAGAAHEFSLVGRSINELAKLADALSVLARHRGPIFGTALPALRDTCTIAQL